MIIVFPAPVPGWPIGLGKCLANRGMRVVFGGSAFGLLGTLADAVLEEWGQLTGIIPEFFTREYEGVYIYIIIIILMIIFCDIVTVNIHYPAILLWTPTMGWHWLWG